MPEPPPALVSAVLALLGVRRGQVVADLCPGHGRLTRPAAAAATSAGRVLACSPGIEALGSAHLLATDPAWARVHWVVGDPAAMPVPEASVDAALWVPDPAVRSPGRPDGVLAELRRITRPGSRVVLGFPGGRTGVPADAIERHRLVVAHVMEEIWGPAPVVLVAVRRA